MGTSSFSVANRQTRIGNQPYQDTDAPTGLEVTTGPTSESTQTDPVVSTVDGPEGDAADATKATAVEPRKRRRGATLASLDSSVNRPSILGN